MPAPIAPLTFFRVVPLHSPFMLAALMAVGGAGGAMIVLDPSMAADAVAPVALLQMFAASSGFALPARRGHFDLVLTGGAPRLRIAATHLALSVLPGLLLWGALALMEAVAARTLEPRALAWGTIFAMGIISLVAWAVTVPLPRLSGGIGWLLLSALAFSGWFDWRVLLPAVEAGTLDLATLSVVYLVCPLLLVGADIGEAQAVALAPSILVAALAVAGAMWWVTRLDVALESAQ